MCHTKRRAQAAMGVLGVIGSACAWLAGGCGAPAAVPAPPPGPALVAAAGAELPAPVRPSAPPLMTVADLDALVAETWRAAGVAPARPAGEAELLRRVTLDLAGRIPTRSETDAFLACVRDRGSDCRVALVDRLLASADHAEHFGQIYADLLLTERFRKPRFEERLAPRSWFVEQFRANRPYDQMVRDLLTFRGPVEPAGPGAFLASHGAMGGGAEAMASATARAFLGVQLQCAQCHDHPTDARYKQEDFWGLVAFFSRTKARQQTPERAAARGMAPEPPPDADAAGMAGAALPGAGKDGKIFVVFDAGGGEARFKRPGATVETTAAPRFLGRDIGPAPGETRREAVARAVLASDLFAKAAVDRTWAQLFGRGIVEPWDDLGGEEDPHHPPLLSRLAQDFQRSGYDLRRLVRLIVLSRAYGLTSRAEPGAPTPPGAPEPTALFARAAVRRLSPEVLFRSLMIATGAQAAPRTAEEMQKKTQRALREYRYIFGDDEMAVVDRFDGNVPQALLLWNGVVTNEGARARPWSTLGRAQAASPDLGASLSDLFMATVQRTPSPLELPALMQHLSAVPGTADMEDIFFALLTSTEMVTNH